MKVAHRSLAEVGAAITIELRLASQAKAVGRPPSIDTVRHPSLVNRHWSFRHVYWLYVNKGARLWQDVAASDSSSD
jgi:hypothetical protein